MPPKKGRVFGLTEPNAGPAGSEQLFGLASRRIQAGEEARMNDRCLDGRWGPMETRGVVGLVLLLLFAAMVQGFPW
jgi:hypothetical protein